MKRKIALSCILLLFLTSIVAAASARDVIEGKTGINPDTLKDPQQLKEEYLKQNWADLIAKNGILGPINNFFLKISPFFQVVFGQPYSLSIILLLVILLWIYVVTKSDAALHAYSFLNRPAQIAISIGIGIVLAQLQVFSKITQVAYNLVISPDQWWMRLITILIIVIIAFVIHYGAKLTIQLIKKTRQQKRELDGEETLEETKAFLKGVKEGKKLGD